MPAYKSFKLLRISLVKISSTISIDKVEELYGKLERENEILIPKSFKKFRIGLVSLLSQLFITAAKNYPTTVLKYYTVGGDDLSLQHDIIKDPISLTALLMFSEVQGKDTSALKIDMNRLLVERFDKSIVKNGHTVTCLAVDHSIRKYAYPSCFYDSSGPEILLKGESFYATLLKRFISGFVRLSDIHESELDGLGDLIFELISNTEQHAKAGFLSGEQKCSVRGLNINYRLLNQEHDISSIAGENNSINRYLTSVRPSDGPLHLLEISVFDSGAGIASSYSKGLEDMPFEKEVEVVLKSFLEGVTSKSNFFGYGRGLNKARHLISARDGFVSVRTGRMSFYRDYKNFPLSIDNDEGYSSDVVFFDDLSGTDDFSEMANAAGLSYTILVPLK